MFFTVLFNFFSRHFLMITVFRHNVNEICTFLGFYIEQNGNSIHLDCLTFGDGADRLSQDIDT